MKAGIETNPGPMSYKNALVGRHNDISKQTSQILAEEIFATVQRCGLPLSIDRLTPADGNCFSHAILDQLRRNGVYEHLELNVLEIIQKENVGEFKMEVSKYAKLSSHPNLLNFKAAYNRIVQPVDNVSWDEYWTRHEKLGEWATSIFVQVTAWMCKSDIIIISTSNTPAHPYITISGNIENENIATECPPLLLGTKSNIHYQSLKPVDETRIARCQPESRNIPQHNPRSS